MIKRISRPLAFLFTATLAPALFAQEDIDPKGIQPFGDLYDVRWTVDEQGRTLMSPNPFATDDSTLPLFGDPHFDAGPAGWAVDALQNGGVGLWLLIVSPGPSDLASLCDAENHFRRLRLSLDEEDLVARILTDPTGNPVLARRAALDRLLAVRLAADRGLRAAVPALTTVAADPDVTPVLRRAAAESLATLEGRPAPAWEQPLEPLDAVLARMPESFDSVSVVQFEAMPNVRGLATRSRKLGLEVTRRAILDAGGTASRYQLAGGQRLADVAAELPYEVARRFGNARFRRVVAGMAADPTGNAQAYVLVEGLFDPDAVHAALVEMGEEGTELKDGRLVAEVEGARLELSSDRIELRTGQFKPVGDAWKKSFGDARPSADDAHWYWVEDLGTLQLPVEDVPFVEGLSGPALIRIRLRSELLLEAHLSYDTEGNARLAANAIRNLPGLALVGMPAGESREMAQDLLRGFSVKAEGQAVTAVLRQEEFSLMGFFDELGRAAVKSTGR